MDVIGGIVLAILAVIGIVVVAFAGVTIFFSLPGIAGIGGGVWLWIEGHDNLGVVVAIAGIIGNIVWVTMLDEGFQRKSIRSEPKQLKKSQKEIEREREESLRLQRQREQHALVEKMTTLRNASVQISGELTELVNNAFGWLQRAEKEYGSNAYGPFWDAVENATQNMGVFYNKTAMLKKNAKEYFEIAQKKEGDAPAYPVRRTDIPRSEHVLNELSRIVRLGQTNFEFANIWEHRRTREVLIAGFQTLDSAIMGLQYEMGKSIGEFSDIVSEHMSEQSEMLDNIQNRRKPYPY